MVRNRHSPYTAFLNGFHGFCSVFVTAAFAYTGTELTGLAAAETANPRKEIPRASKQVVWRIAIFYIVNLFLVGLIVPANSPLYSWRRLRIASFTFCHCNSACWHQGPPIDFQCRHLDRRHERCKLLHFWLDSNNSGSRCKWCVRDSIILYDANFIYRHGS